jgi:Cu(I)/Ag(I) efflux system membrane fusion protein
MMSMHDDVPARSADESGQMIELIEPYLALQAALANDDLDGAQAALKRLMSITGHSGELAKLVHQMMAAKSLDALRRPHFETLSNHMITAVQAAPEAFEETLYLMHCPMVYEDRGADWLQRDQVLLNPYYGAMMLHCGEVQETLNND